MQYDVEAKTRLLKKQEEDFREEREQTDTDKDRLNAAIKGLMEKVAALETKEKTSDKEITILRQNLDDKAFAIE